MQSLPLYSYHQPPPPLIFNILRLSQEIGDINFEVCIVDLSKVKFQIRINSLKLNYSICIVN